MIGGTKNNVLVTKPSERFQDTHVILIFLVKFENRRVKTLCQDASPERRRDWGVKRSPNSPIYIIPKWLKTFLDSITPAIRSSRGLLSRGRLWYQLVTPTMRLYLPRVRARLRGITALWFSRKKGHLHTIPCNEQEWDKELAYNRHFTKYINKSYIIQRYTHRSDYGTKRKEDNPTARSPIITTGLHYWSTWNAT